MKIIQRGRLKFVGLIIILNFSLSICEGQSHRLKTADSLFQAKRYTQSLEHYEEILRQKYYTPAMLLKMAYIHEGLDQPGTAMYYLNLYHLATNDDEVLPKIEEVARKSNLQGYETTDQYRVLAFYHKHHVEISIAIAALMVFFVALAYDTRMRRHKRPLGAAITVSALALILVAHLFPGANRTTAIIAGNTTFIMDGPSAGASVVDIVGDGHRVQVLGKRDVWVKILWDDNVAYVKENTLRELRPL